MPERKRLIGAPREHAQYVADAARLPAAIGRGAKKSPENRGPFVESMISSGQLNERSDLTSAGFTGSKPEIGEIAVTYCHASADHQQAVDGDHQAAEQGGGGHEADGSSLGHNSLLLEAQRTAAS